MREYQHAAMQTLPRWARVVRVGRRVFGTVSVDVKIHYGLTPPHVEPVSVSVPRGMKLQVGQDVFVVGPNTNSDSNHTTWILDVTRPPQYGSWPTPPEFLRDAPPGAASPAAAPPGLVERRLQILRVHLRQGTISQEEYEQHLREVRLEDQGSLPNVPKLLRKLSCQASTTRPWEGGQPVGVGELLFSGIERYPGPEAVAEPSRQVAQATEVLGPDGLGRLDLDADHGACCVLQHYRLHLAPPAKPGTAAT
jgi:hypothetical protein